MKARRWTARLLLGLGTLLILLLLGEATLWASGLVRDPRDFTLWRMTGALQQDAAGRYVLDDVRGFSTGPGFRFSPTHAGRDATGGWQIRRRWTGCARTRASALPTGRVYVQAVWAPAGEDPGESLAARWTGVVELDG